LALVVSSLIVPRDLIGDYENILNYYYRI